MAADQAPQAPSGGGLSTLPTWAYFAIGGVLIGGFLLWRRHAAGTSSASTQGPLVPGVATDPNTGLPIDPTTGLPYITSQPSQQTGDNSTWLQSAEAAAKGLGYAPALVQQSLYDFLSGNALNNRESGVINALLGRVGYPPVLIPFLGNPPTPPKPPRVKPAKPTTAPAAGKYWWFSASAWKWVLQPISKAGTLGGYTPPAKATPRPVVHSTTALRPHVPGWNQLANPFATPPAPATHLLPGKVA